MLMAGLGVADWTPRKGSRTKESHKGDGQRTGRDRRQSAPATTRRATRSEDKESQAKKSCERSTSQTPAPAEQHPETFSEVSRKNAFSQLAGASRWLSGVLSQAADQLEDPSPAAPPRPPQIAFRASGVKLTHWPPETGYCDAFDGWQTSESSSEWLYKPSNGIYFHKPSESLWKRARGDRMKFARVDGASGSFDSIAIAAWGDSRAGRRALLRACVLAWSQQLRKFDDMDRELSHFQEGTMSIRPRTSASSTPNRGDRLANLLLPAAATIANLMESLEGAPTTWRSRPTGAQASKCNAETQTPEHSRSPSLSGDESNGSLPSETLEPESEPVTAEILRMRAIARKAKS